MMLFTNQTVTFTDGTATLLMNESIEAYEKTLVNVFAQLKSASTAIITSATVSSSNEVVLKCSNLSGSTYTGTITVTLCLILV